MKSNFTKIGFNLIIMAMVLISTSATAQTMVDINVLSMIFSPASLTIDAGDTVRWRNPTGFHNINGTTATYPSNPVSFDNGAVASGWTYTFVFTTAGTYTYQCDQHALSGMVATIIVLPAGGINDNSGLF